MYTVSELVKDLSESKTNESTDKPLPFTPQDLENFYKMMGCKK